jgi:UDP-arabinose 4-epimerase
MDKRILVTGGAGYVGAHACKRFHEVGWEVFVYDNLLRGWRDMVQWGPLIQGDILDRDSLDRAIRDVKPAAIAHFAALSYVGESVLRPDMYYRNNVAGTMNILDAMYAHGIRRIVFSSTCATYGEPQYLPMDEAHPQAPINPYGRSKLMAEMLLQDYSDAFGIRSVALRYFNAAGADPAAVIGERHEPETHLIPLALRGAGDPEYCLGIFGDDYPTRDGTAVRDYIHVSDLAEAHLRALDYLVQGGATTAINLGTGTGTSVHEIWHSVERITARAVNKQVLPRRPGDPASLVADAAKAKQVLGWQAQRSAIDTVIADAWRWHEAEQSRSLARTTPGRDDSE